MSAPPSRDGVRAWMFLAPFALVFAAFTLVPMLESVPLALQQTYGPSERRAVGVRNFSHLLGDPLFWIATRNTLLYTLGSLLIQIPLAFVLALALNAPRLRGRAIYRLVFFSPQLMGLVFASVLGALVFEKRSGLVNRVLSGVMGDPSFVGIAWLQDHIIATLIIISLWLYTGFNMIFFLAALQNIDPELAEASELDGAGPLNRLRHVVLPSIRPVAMFVVVLSMIGSLQLFELPYVLLDGGSGPNNRGLTIIMYLYQNGFEHGDLGYASAIGWTLSAVLIALGVMQLRVLSRRRLGP